MKKILILFAIVLTLGVSCSRSNSPNVGKDLSLTPAEYIELGFPAPDRPWTTPDYQVVFRTMQTLPIALFPRTKSPKSGVVMDRLTNIDNLSVFFNRSLPLNQRLMLSLDFLDAVNGITKLYLAACNRAPLYADDLLLMQGFMLHATVAQLELVDEFLPTLDKTDPTYPTRIEGLNKMKQGIAQMIQGALISLEERKLYSEQSREEFASTIAATFPNISTHLPALSVIEFKTTLRRIASQETNTSIKSSIMKAIDSQ